MRNVHDFNKFLICTDSLGILKEINGFPKNKNPSYIILDIIEEINKLRVDEKGLISRSVGKFQITSMELELAIRDADKPCPDCGGSD